MAIRLIGDIEYNVKFPPANAKKGYVARISGRVSGAAQFDREFLGNTVLVDEPGLYERQTGLKKGGADQSYCVILDRDGELVRSTDFDREEALAIAKRLEAGEKLEDFTLVDGLRPSKKTAGLMIFDFAFVPDGETNVDKFIRQVRELLDKLSPDEQIEAATRLLEATE